MKPFFLTIPHSGERVPPEVTWLANLPETTLMCDVDRFVDQLYAPVLREMPLPSVKTEWHRYVVDLNRLPEDVDASSVQGHVTAAGQFPMGLHWVKTTTGIPLMPKPMPQELHQQLVARYFEPFHEQVRAMYAQLKAVATKVYHLDAHSMPSVGTKSHRDPGQKRADIVVSDWEGKSCEPEFKDLVIRAYQAQGFTVAYNWPYLGGRVTQTYGRPDLGQHAIQVELNRALYMDESSKQLIFEKAEPLKARLTCAVQTIYSGLRG